MGRAAALARALIPGQPEPRAWSSTNLSGMVGGRGMLRSERKSGGSYDGAQAHAAVYACVDLLVRIVAWQMPVATYRDASAAEAAPKTAVRNPRIVANPHPEPHLSAAHWRSMALESAVLRGYAAGVVTAFEASGWPAQVQPLHPDEVSWVRRGGATEWQVMGKPAALWQLGGDLWVAPAPRVEPGCPVGKSVLRHAADQIELGLGAVSYGGGFFANANVPSAILSIDVPQITDEQRRDIKARFMESAANRQPVVLTQIADYKPIAIAPEESQFLQTLGANVAQVCMFFGVPPEAIGGSSGDSMTYANVEGRNLALLTNTVGAWMQWFEWVFTSLLPAPQTVELDPEALLRTSVPTLYDTAQKGVGRGSTPGVLTVNEARQMLGYQPIADGDRLYVPANYLPADLADQSNQLQPQGGGNG